MTIVGDVLAFLVLEPIRDPGFDAEPGQVIIYRPTLDLATVLIVTPAPELAETYYGPEAIPALHRHATSLQLLGHLPAGSEEAARMHPPVRVVSLDPFPGFMLVGQRMERA